MVKRFLIVKRIILPFLSREPPRVKKSLLDIYLSEDLKTSKKPLKTLNSS